MSLTNYERETIVNFNEADPEAYIFTYNKKLIAKLSRFTEENPQICELQSTNKEGGATYKINKDRLSINFRKPLSDEERERRRAIAKAHGFGKGETC